MTIQRISQVAVCLLGLVCYLIVGTGQAYASPLTQVVWSGSASDNLSQVAVNPATGRMLVGYGSSIYASSDSGASWTAAGQGLLGQTPTIFASANGSFFALCGSNGIYRLLDGSLTWVKVFAQAGYVAQFAESPDAGVLGCVTAEGNLYRSLDGGTSWTLLAVNLPGSPGAQLGLAVVDQHTFLFSIYLFQVYRTTDDGATFTPATGLPSSSPTAILVNGQNQTQLFLGSYWNGVQLSNDGGQSWAAFNTGLPANRGVSALKQGADGTIYALVADQIGGEGLYRLASGGSTWEAFTGGVAFPLRNKTGSFGVNAAGDAFVSFGIWGLWGRPHGQSAWSQVNTGKNHGQPPFVRSLAVDLSDRLFCGVNGTGAGPNGGLGIFSSTNRGQSWFVAGEDYTDADVIGLACDENNYSYASTYWFKVIRSTDGGATWTKPGTFTFPSSPVQLLAVGNRLYAGTYWNGVYVSEDQAATWNVMGGLPAGRGASALGVLGDRRLITLVADQSGVVGPYRTTVSGSDWEPDANGLPDGAAAQLVSVGHGGGGVGYAWGPGMLFRQITATSNWNAVALPGGFNVLCVSPSPVGGTLVGTAGGGIFHRDESAGTWEKVGDTRLDGRMILTVAVGRDGTVFAGTDQGVFSGQPGNFSGLVPAITSQPQNQSAAAGGSVNFTVLVSGAGLNYQWEKNGVPILGANDATFSLAAVAAGDAGAYRVVAGNSAGIAVSQTVTLAVLSPFIAWQQGKFTPTELADATKSGPSAVYGLDGIPNLVKYALGLEPKQDAAAGLPAVSTDGTDWIYQYNRPAGMTDVTYEVQVSTDLTSWTGGGVTHGLVTTVSGIETWQARLPLNNAANVFFRLKVTIP